MFDKAKAVVRSATLPIARPIWRRIWPRIEARMIPRLEANLLRRIEARLATSEASWQAHIPAFLNAVSTVGAFGHKLAALQREVAAQRGDLGGRVELIQRELHEVSESATQESQRRLGELWQRVEFIRRELLFEFKYGGSVQWSRQEGAAAAPRILAQDKVGEAISKGDVRLNLGCGHILLPDYINVDMRELPGVDIVASVDALPFEPGTVNEIHSAHLIEHFPQEALRRRLLPYWVSLLREGGRFSAITPDAATMIAAAAKGDYPYEEFREFLFGAQDYEGDFHYNLLTPDSMRGLLEECGLTAIETPVTGRRNGKCFEFEIAGLRA